MAAGSRARCGRTADCLRLKACFAAGTKLSARGEWGEGYRCIEEITTADEVLSRSEFDERGPLEWKRVEETFTRFAEVVNVHAGGRIVRTTSEHPFYVVGKAEWVAAQDLAIGDALVGHDGVEVVVEGVAPSGLWLPVYNLRVADYHTYFVGDEAWNFSVWAHNAECSINQVRKTITESGGEAYAINRKTAAAIRDFIKSGTDEGWEAAKSLLRKTGANLDDLSWSLLRKYGRTDAVKRVALSTDPPLDSFARQVGGVSWKQFAKADPLHWKNAFLDLLYGSDSHFVVNMKGLQVSRGIERASMGRGGATDWELLQLYQAKEHHHRITWLLDGKVQPPPSLFG